ncbi:MAG: SDR family oxidoreductase [Gammaproteobacteria bacterium]|nr:SDR family oxidoreductase [Gammaproteobacteria bacterium]
MKDSGRSPLLGRTALVTGAAQRTGRGLALALAEAGADICIHYHRSGAEAESLQARIEAIGRRAWLLPADLAQPGSAEALIEQVKTEVGEINILINNVGNYPLMSPLEHSPELLRQTLETNLLAPFALIRSAVPLLQAAETADVINIGYAGVEYALGHLRAMAYQISKTALLQLTRSLALELGPMGIRINMVSPGHLENSVDLPTVIDTHVPLGRAGRIEDITGAVLYLLQPGSYIHGANLEVSGGYRMSLAENCRDT